MSRKFSWLCSILGVAMCSGLASAERTATVRFEIPGYKTPENDYERKWYLYIDSPTGIVGLSNGLTSGALCEIDVQPDGLESTTGIYEFTFTSTGTNKKGATLHIAYGFQPVLPTGIQLCEATPIPLTGHLEDTWYVLSEFIFNPGGGSVTPTSSNLGDISYVADFSHPMKVDVYGSSDGTSWGERIASRAPDQMVKQILINELFISDGFRSPDGAHDINTTGIDGVPPVWVNSFDNQTYCTVLTEADCFLAGGSYAGDDQPCTTNPCGIDRDTGACCVGAYCTVKTKAACTAANGSYNGDGSSCEGNHPCEVVIGTGACCVGVSTSSRIANTLLWQPLLPGQTWDPKKSVGSEAGFIRINQPNKVFTSVVSGDLHLPGYHDAMHRLHTKYSVGSEHAILIAGSATGSCNAQNPYFTGGSWYHSGGIGDCFNYDPQCDVYPPSPGLPLPGIGRSGADKYKVWAQVDTKSDSTGTAYWFEVTTTNPVDTNETGYIRAPVAQTSQEASNHWVSSDTLYIPAVAGPSISATATTINNHLYGRLVSGSVKQQGLNPDALQQMAWNGTVNGGSTQNVFEAGDDGLKASAAAMLRDICVTLSTGQLGSDIPYLNSDSAKIGYAFHEPLANGTSGFFWVNSTPNRFGEPLLNNEDKHYWDCIAATCSCILDFKISLNGDKLLGYGWDEDENKTTGTTADLSTGQMSYLNNWFDQLVSHDPHCAPWNESYRVMFNKFGSEVYTNDYTDYYQYYNGLDPQFECDSHNYMKYVFTLGTMQFADLASEMPHEGDGKVGILDLLYLLQNWGPDGSADLNSDQTVNATDMILLLNNWTGPAFATGACCIYGVCSIRSQQDCDNVAGSYYYGDWTNCVSSPPCF